MILSLLALAALGRQTNPPGVPVLPCQAAFFSSAGATEVVEMRNAQGQVLPFTDTAGTTYSHVTLTIPSGIAVGLGWQITQTSPDGIHPLRTPSSAQYALVVRVASGSATESPVGTFDSSPGAGNGIATGYPAPDAGSPTIFGSGVTYTISAGGVVLSSLASGSASVSDPAMPVNVNPLALCLADIGGAGVTAGIEFRDANGTTIPLVDSSGVAWSAVTVAVSPSASLGIAFGILNAKPDGIHPIAALPISPAYLIVRCLTGTANVPTLAINAGGLATGASGTGSYGFNAGYGPNASTPIQFYVGDYDRFGRVR
ncbi:MAG: hypothetical protein P4L46_17470 [Fimbriimonas sp.]|nr:hypothetical protein [Fimbriimonas sp.]